MGGGTDPLAALAEGTTPRRVAAAAAARRLSRFDFSVTATSASSEAPTALGGFAAEVNVVVTGRH
jgi:hypothetical protein